LVSYNVLILVQGRTVGTVVEEWRLLPFGDGWRAMVPIFDRAYREECLWDEERSR